MSATTRDWLLQKLLKMRDSLTAVTRERDEARSQRNEAMDVIQRKTELHVEAVRELQARIHQMAPQKQFAINLRGPSGMLWRCPIDAVNSANGTTLITVQLPASFIREYGLSTLPVSLTELAAGLPPDADTSMAAAVQPVQNYYGDEPWAAMPDNAPPGNHLPEPFVPRHKC